MSASATVRDFDIQIRGLDEIEKRMDIEVLAQPEFDLALETFRKRIERRPRRAGPGITRNTLMSQTKPLTVTTTSTLHYPRTTGYSWGRTMYAALHAMAPRVVSKAVRRIEARMAGNNPS